MKAMFKSQAVSIKDFFSSNQRHGLHIEGGISDSAIDNSSQSQFPYSQIEFPDTCTQEYSQNAQQSCSQTSDSPGRRFASQKFASKGHLHPKENPTRLPLKMNSSYQHQLQSNKTKAKERDDRDMMTSMVSAMSECSTDMQHAVKAMRENVQQGIVTSENSIFTAFEKIQSHLENHTEKMRSAMEVKTNVTQKIAALESTIESKNSELAALQKELGKIKEENHRRLISELQKSFVEGQENTTDNLQEMYDRHHQELAKHKKSQERQHKDLLKHTEILHKNLVEEHVGSLQELFTNLLQELGRVCDEVKSSKDNSDVAKRMQILQKQHFVEVQSLLKNQFKEIQRDNHKNHADVLQSYQEELQTLQEKQGNQLYLMISQQMKGISDQQILSLKTLVNELAKEDQMKLAQAREMHGNQDRNFHNRVETELASMKERFLKEVSTILSEKQQVPEPKQVPQNDKIVPPKTFRPVLSCFSPTVLTNGVLQKESSNMPFNNFPDSTFGSAVEREKSVKMTTKTYVKPSWKEGKYSDQDVTSDAVVKQRATFISPLLRDRNWTSKSLFGRQNNPSPIAAVIPQLRKHGKVDKKVPEPMQMTELDSQVPLVTVDEESQAPASSKTNTNKKKRRKRAPKFSNKKKKVNSSTTNTNTQQASESQTRADRDEDETQFVVPQSESILKVPAATKIATHIETNIHSKRTMLLSHGKQPRPSLTGAVYDFHDEDTIAPVFPKGLRTDNESNAAPSKTYSRANNQSNRNASIFGEREESSQDELCSADSSPCLSITEVVIRRRIKQEKNSPSSTPAVSLFQTTDGLHKGDNWKAVQEANTKDSTNPSCEEFPWMRPGPLILKRPKRTALMN